MFLDRYEAGSILGELLIKYKSYPNAVVIGLPRGGVITAYAVSKKLELPLDVICPRKIGAPMNSEFAIGAVTETGDILYDADLLSRLRVSDAYLKEISLEQIAVAKARIKQFRRGLVPRILKDKVVILVDDGLATGATMKAAIKTARSEKAQKVIVGVPVAPQETCNEIRCLVDELYCVMMPPFFQAVGQFYQSFSQTEDCEVIDLLSKRNNEIRGVS